MSKLTEAVVRYLKFRQKDESYCDIGRDLYFLLPNALAILYKLNGLNGFKKLEKVSEIHMLCAGTLPESHETPCVEVE